MKNFIAKSVLALVSLAMLAVPAPTRAQSSSDLGMTIRVNPTTASPGAFVGVFSIVTNNTTNKLNTAVTFTALSPCGVESVIGYSRLSLDGGKSIQVTVSYPVPEDACRGTYTISITAKSSGGTGKKSSPSSSATSASAYLTVQ